MPRKRWAFLVGVNEYLDYSRLRYCVDDVRALASLLDQIGYVPFCLHDRVDPRSQPFPTRDNIETELETLLEKVTEDDLLLVYFACHGVRAADGKPMLVVSQTRKRKLSSTAISIADYLEPKIRTSPAKQKVLMLDACFIGAGRGERDPAEYLRRVSNLTSGFELLSASTEQQEALESSELKHGVFCHFLMEGLAGAAAMGQKIVMLSSLQNYIRAEIDEYTTRHGNIIQIPQHRSDKDAGDFLLVDYDINPVPNLEAIPDTDPMTSSEGQVVQGRGRLTGEVGKSPSQVIESLWSLDCEPQCHTFKTSTPRTRRAAAFVVQARDSRIQHWLVKRLVNQIPNVANAKVFSFTVPAHPMWKQRNVNEFWVELANKLKCSNDSSDIIEALVRVYQTKPIIIAMYGWPNINRSQTLQQQILDDFWKPLIEAVGSLKVQPLRSRAILFFAEGCSHSTLPRGEAVSAAESIFPIRLEPLTEITSEHIADWMESDTVFPILQQFISEDQIGSLISEEILEWSSEPATAIEQICYIFELENGIADIEAEWRLAG
ncbi:MAG: caspase family protein [Cyanobacteria bacterium J06642_11]